MRLLLTLTPGFVLLVCSWMVADVALAVDCRWIDMDPNTPGVQELVDNGSQSGCGVLSEATYTQVGNCPCSMTLVIDVAVGTSESWSIQSTDPVTGEHVIELRGTGTPLPNPVLLQVVGYNCGHKLSVRLIVDCSDNTTSMPIDLSGACNNLCE